METNNACYPGATRTHHHSKPLDVRSRVGRVRAGLGFVPADEAAGIALVMVAGTAAGFNSAPPGPALLASAAQAASDPSHQP
eukprot:CAMPEP_0202860740 /NCGR_PEP_ID=MMETSP1391-20130828/2359_1 /ASSEMBLY_ACC=CAM_ASM_000867 /TAXON_ID=1034604 /ORGANISM="Chlamydomonas leiostraca, Strain SAG 11-49" /LENGTH=81 /DNA_ID=CAMNT_0049539975 /DNA_START=161 /DNA_END=402 /DNA_ORIENTATION=-